VNEVCAGHTEALAIDHVPEYIVGDAEIAIMAGSINP